jgi:hypothetical protein
MVGIKEEIHILPSNIETIDFALYDHINDRFDLHATTNEGWDKVPVIWVTAERSHQIKHNKGMRDLEGTLNLPIIFIERISMTKDPAQKGVFQANIPPAFLRKGYDVQGGSIEVARKIQQKKTSEFANVDSKRRANRTVKPNFVRKKTEKVVYETISIPQPVYVYTSYTITLRTQYQQQMNDLLQPFITRPGNVRNISLTKDGHFYEAFVDTTFSTENTVANLNEEERKYETKITINVIGYLLGDGVNSKGPKISIRENAVEVKMPRERVLVGDIPDYIDSDEGKRGVDGGYRE